jgi:drug/metabolite transporter (DMT)-like permease
MLAGYAARGVKAGVAAGVAFGLFVALVGDPLVGLAEGLAVGHDGAQGHPETPFGAATSVAAGGLWGLVAGVCFGVAYYFSEPVLPGNGDTRGYLLAAAGFVTVAGAPWLVLPPRPAGTPQPLGADVRLFWYGLMMVAGAFACGLAVYAYSRIERRHGSPSALAAAALPFGLLAVPALVAPAAPIETGIEGLVAVYRGVVGVGQLVLWGTLASAHAWLCRRDDAATERGLRDAGLPRGD